MDWNGTEQIGVERNFISKSILETRKDMTHSVISIDSI